MGTSLSKNKDFIELNDKNANVVEHISDIANGIGTLTYLDLPSGVNVNYNGAISNHLRHGEGTLKIINNACDRIMTVTGTWINDKIHNGILETKISDKIIVKYAGDFKIDDNLKQIIPSDFIAHGKGSVQNDEYTCEGEYENDSIHGICKMIMGNDDIFEGKFEESKACGIMKYNNGDIYEGKFEESKKCGHGIMKYNNGDIYDGEWDTNKKKGQGIMKYNNGDSYDGEWENGLKKGQGIYTYVKMNSRCIDFWVNGKPKSSIWKDI